MQKTMKQLITMYQDGKFPIETANSLHTNQSTQRDFIYNSLTVEREDGILSKAGDVIRSILQENIQLPALYFWNIQDDTANIHYKENEYNLHDGKQRFLSIYKFIRCDGVITRLINPITGESKEYGWMDLTKEQQEKLLNYKFDIVVRTGTQAEEEKSFYLINNTGETLTAYESLHGAYHGTFLDMFEDYICMIGNSLNKIKKTIGRGEQALWLLLLATDRFDGSKADKNKEKLINRLKDKLSDIRNTVFDPKENNFDKKIELYNELCTVLKSNTDKNPIKVCRITRYIIERHYPIQKVLTYYRNILKDRNDIDSWKFGTHKTALDRLCLDNIECDGLRFFSKEDQNELFKANHHCAICGKDLNWDEATFDHNNPWSKGGRTERTNGRVMCCSCNSSKGATYDEEGEY